MRIAPEVAEAVAGGRPVVALESTLISHGLPRPRNLEVARQLEAAVRAAGAMPATVAVVAGQARIGLDEEALEAVAGVTTWSSAACAISRRWRPAAGYGATTVAATAHLAALAGIRLFATGGPGRRASRGARDRDESADLETLARVGIVVVCSGVKSILDVGATLERLETLGVTVLGYGSDRFAGFYLPTPGFRWRGGWTSPAEVAEVVRAGASSAPGTGPWSWPIRCRRASNSIRPCTSACWPRAWPPSRAARAART